MQTTSLASRLRLTIGRKRIVPIKLKKTRLVLEIPSAAAAQQFYQRLHGWRPDLLEPWATRRAPVPQGCPQHVGQTASWICGRCGGFACDACLSRVRPDAMPLCRDCIARRAAR